MCESSALKPLPFSVLLLTITFFFASSVPVEAQITGSEPVPPTFDRAIPACQEAIETLPQLTCRIVVDDLEHGLFARITGPKACVQGVNLGGGFTNFVVRYEIAERNRDDIRFSGTERVCSPPVSEAPDCDFSDSPFLGLECVQPNTDQQTLSCPDCALSPATICYSSLTETSVDIHIRNVNNCSSGLRSLVSYMIAVKSKQIDSVEGQEYRRIYLVDPTVIQEPNCPGGIC